MRLHWEIKVERKSCAWQNAQATVSPVVERDSYTLFFCARKSNRRLMARKYANSIFLSPRTWYASFRVVAHTVWSDCLHIVHFIEYFRAKCDGDKDGAACCVCFGVALVWSKQETLYMQPTRVEITKAPISQLFWLCCDTLKRPNENRDCACYSTRLKHTRNKNHIQSVKFHWFDILLQNV